MQKGFSKIQASIRLRQTSTRRALQRNFKVQSQPKAGKFSVFSFQRDGAHRVFECCGSPPARAKVSVFDTNCESAGSVGVDRGGWRLCKCGVRNAECGMGLLLGFFAGVCRDLEDFCRLQVVDFTLIPGCSRLIPQFENYFFMNEVQSLISKVIQWWDRGLRPRF
jgi:hypothetical protein